MIRIRYTYMYEYWNTWFLHQNLIFPCVRCTSDVSQGGLRVHPAGLGHVPRERGAPAGHVQLLNQLPRLLLCLQPVQGGPL